MEIIIFNTGDGTVNEEEFRAAMQKEDSNDPKAMKLLTSVFDGCDTA